MRRVNVHLEEAADDAAEREARRRGVSKAELIRRGLARELSAAYDLDTAWETFVAADGDEPLADLDAVIYDDHR